MLYRTIRVLAVVCLAALSACSAAPQGPERGEAVRVHERAMFVAAADAPRGIDAQAVADLTLRPDARGAWTMASAPVRLDAPFYEALVSFNADVPPAAGLAVDLRVSRPGFVSPWLRLARWGEAMVPGAPIREFRDEALGLSGMVDVDYFRSAELWETIEYRAIAVGPAGGDVRLRRVSIAATTARRAWTQGAFGQERTEGGDIRLDVPFRSQKTPDAKLSGRLCSPTSLAMVLAYRGVERSVAEVAGVCLDEDFDLYGNWPRNVQAAAGLGVDGYLTRVGTMAQAEAYLRAGQPIIASIQVEREGELRGAPYKATAGHLIVLTGLTAAGDFYVNDPAAGTPETGMLVYRRDDLRNVWLARTKGTAYILLSRTSGEARADRARP